MLWQPRDQGAASAGSLGELLPGDSTGDVLGAQGATPSRFPGISTRMSVAGCADSFLLPISCCSTLHFDSQMMERRDGNDPVELRAEFKACERQAKTAEEAARRMCCLSSSR